MRSLHPKAMESLKVRAEFSFRGRQFSDLFFFSSRRRHTRLQGDWSSDVCSSDLGPSRIHSAQQTRRLLEGMQGGDLHRALESLQRLTYDLGRQQIVLLQSLEKMAQIGRASCRERV